MVQKLDPHDVAGLRDAFGEPDVFVAGRRIAGRMVVDEDHAGGRLADGERDNFARLCVEESYVVQRWRRMWTLV
jgi:hypothetical protein